jgi:Family of unknown function (DUF5681)
MATKKTTAKKPAAPKKRQGNTYPIAKRAGAPEIRGLVPEYIGNPGKPPSNGRGETDGKALRPGDPGYVSPGQWKPGQSGNPKGRPRNRMAEEFARLRDSEKGAAMVHKFWRAAFAGDIQAAKLFLTDVIRREAGKVSSTFRLGPIDTLERVAKERARVIEAALAGEIDEAREEKIMRHLADQTTTLKLRDDLAYAKKIDAMLRVVKGEARVEDLKEVLGDERLGGPNAEGEKGGGY